MGYTHYFHFKGNPAEIKNGKEKFLKAVELFKKGLKKAGNKVKVTYNIYKKDYPYTLEKTVTKEVPLDLRGGNGFGEPVITDTTIIFNGDRSAGHWGETFFLTSERELEGCETFCKTGHEPYDFAVCLALRCVKHFFGEDFYLSSDGDIVGGEEGWGTSKEIFDAIV